MSKIIKTSMSADALIACLGLTQDNSKNIVYPDGSVLNANLSDEELEDLKVAIEILMFNPDANDVIDPLKKATSRIDNFLKKRNACKN